MFSPTVPIGIGLRGSFQLELELIQTQMAQKPMLRACNSHIKSKLCRVSPRTLRGERGLIAVHIFSKILFSPLKFKVGCGGLGEANITSSNVI